jgi:hypothetical protein
MRPAILIVLLSVLPASAGRSQEGEARLPAPPPRMVLPPEADAAKPQSGADQCTPQPACRVFFLPFSPAAPGGGLKIYGWRRGDPNIQEWAGPGPVDPRSFKLPRDPGWTS